MKALHDLVFDAARLASWSSDRLPQRIRRRRAKGWHLPLGTICVTRPGLWGNPYYPGSSIGYGFFNDRMEPVNYEAERTRRECAESME